MGEVEWTKEVLIPLLRRVGFRRVEFTHGILEAGRDVVFADYDKFGLQRYYAAQVKCGNLQARSETQEIRTIIDQVTNAYETPYRDVATGTEHCISDVYLIVNGKVTESAKQLLYPKTGPWLSIIDRDQLGIADCLVSTVDSSTRSRVYAFLRNETVQNIKFYENALGVRLDEDDITHDNLSSIELPATMLSTRWLQRALDIAMDELDPFDISLLSTQLEWSDQPILFTALRLG